MNHTLSEQIQGIQEAMRLLKILSHPMDDRDWEMAEILVNRTVPQLNDAGSTLAALNLTKHLPDEGRDEYLDKLISNLCDIVSITRERANVSNIRELVEKETNLKKEILSMSYDVIQSQSTELKEKEKRIAELEEGLRGAANVLRMATLIDKSNTCEKAMVQAESLLNKTN